MFPDTLLWVALAASALLALGAVVISARDDDGLFGA